MWMRAIASRGRRCARTPSALAPQSRETALSALSAPMQRPVNLLALSCRNATHVTAASGDTAELKPAPAAAATSPRARGRRRSTTGMVSKREQELARLVKAIRVFVEREQHFAIPITYEIPRSSGAGAAWPSSLRGLALGMKTHKFMQGLANGTPPKGSTTYVAKLEEMGFPVHTWRQYLFETVLVPALQGYVAIEGDLFVPQKFVVPTGDASRWPRLTWGFPLGLQVAKLRREQERAQLSDEQIRTLDDLGFIWNVRDAKWHQYFLPGLRIFRELHGHVDVPLAFTIPLAAEDEGSEGPWPRYMQGYRLGRHVYMVRSGKYATHVEQSKSELETLGFAFDLSESLWNFTIFPTLEMYSHVYGHCDVPQDFVVPAEDPWPETAYGWRLGHTVRSIRHQGVYGEQVRRARGELERIGFVWNASDRVEVALRRVILPALRMYRDIHGDLLVGTDFVVPEHEPAWPRQAQGFRLGHWITRVRSGQISIPRPLKSELDQLGFVWRFNDERWSQVLLPAFRAYAELHGSCADMNTNFHVPHEAPYPPRAWGVNLGGAMWHMKNGDTYVHDPVKERELKRLGVM